MSLRPAINCLQTIISFEATNRLILRTSIRCLSQKSLDKKVKFWPKNDEKDLAKVMVYLKDENGNILGDKTLIEAKLLAQKMRMTLIEDKEEETFHHKYKPFKLVSNKYLAKLDQIDDKSSAESTQTTTSDPKAVKEVKHLVFTTKLSENDLMTKINQIKRWLLKGHQIAVNVTNPLNDRQFLEKVYHKFESEMKSYAKFNQKKIKTNNTLKFMVLPNFESKDQMKNSTSDDPNVDIDVDNMDPNKLLSDEFEKELEKK